MANDPGYHVADPSLAPVGKQKIEWVARWMTVLNALRDDYKNEGVFEGKRVAISIHLEAKTAYLATIFQSLGAEVWITSSNPHSGKDDVCAALAEMGIHVYAQTGATEEEYKRFVSNVASCDPHVVIDDGADLSEFLLAHPEHAKELSGVCEETTSGVARLRRWERNGKLTFPALAINDAQSKYLFDNRYGTGESAWSAITNLTNLSVAGKAVVCIGYGWVGRGVAMRAAGLGAEVIVTEIDPWKAWEARLDGYRVMPIHDAAPLGDIFITNTGEVNVIRMEHMERMHDGAFLANAGHFGHEIDLPSLTQAATAIKAVREGIEEFTLASGIRLYLLAKGSIVNIAGGLGHPVEILDTSFALQLASARYVMTAESLEPVVYDVPEVTDEEVVRKKLDVSGLAIDEDLRGK